MEQRLPSVPSWQSDLLITHGGGVFISLVMQIGRKDTLAHTHSQGKATFDIMGRLVFPLCDVELRDSQQVYLNEHLKEGMIDSLVQSKHTLSQTWLTWNTPMIGFFSFFFFLGGEVKVGWLIKCILLSVAVTAGSDITATRYSGGKSKIKSHFNIQLLMPLAGIRTRLHLSAPHVLCGELYIHKHNYSDRQAHRQLQHEGDTLPGSLFFQLSVFYIKSKLCSVEKRQLHRSFINRDILYTWPCTCYAYTHSLCATTEYLNCTVSFFPSASTL